MLRPIVFVRYRSAAIVCDLFEGFGLACRCVCRTFASSVSPLFTEILAQRAFTDWATVLFESSGYSARGMLDQLALNLFEIVRNERTQRFLTSGFNVSKRSKPLGKRIFGLLFYHLHPVFASARLGNHSLLRLIENGKI
ncbi:MAG: hypothetical protein P0Y65_14215 [Candidatus Devosia phytovorans]|uniref:Uncharacterized protein n=1 Tax=Candidatus Devosia phytovorans TaxID=3121372 RepID=A0AAJ5VSA2_9HYPH|nr:hypothetical protein [Devosia sp.]WEK03342.1 MAG: hypothetical protein P0Y65_14215 [Devosia sp.]